MPAKGSSLRRALINNMKIIHTPIFHTELTKKKISDALKGKPSGRLGKKHSEETKKRISKKVRERYNNPKFRENFKKIMKWKMNEEEVKKKISQSRKGKHLSEETKQKIRMANKGKKLSKETRKKMSEAKRKMSEETKRKISEANKGKHHSEATKRKLSKMLKGKPQPWNSGKKCNLWINGKGNEPYPPEWRETLKRAIRERDIYTCYICRQYGNEVHHKNYNKKNCNPDNLITLCHNCHNKTRKNRKFWINYFKRGLWVGY
jgi:hypothetical protein